MQVSVEIVSILYKASVQFSYLAQAAVTARSALRPVSALERTSMARH